MPDKKQITEAILLNKDLPVTGECITCQKERNNKNICYRGSLKVTSNFLTHLKASTNSDFLTFQKQFTKMITIKTSIPCAYRKKTLTTHISVQFEPFLTFFFVITANQLNLFNSFKYIFIALRLYLLATQICQFFYFFKLFLITYVIFIKSIVSKKFN